MYSTFSLYEIPETGEKVATGWLPPLPDIRDYTEDDPNLKDINKGLGMTSAKMKSFAAPPKVDLRKWCSPVENQGALGSCTAHAGVGVVEYYERRGFGNHVDGSRRFVYKTTRKLMGLVGDTGAWLRTTMGALALCGVPPEKYWPYTTRKHPGPEGLPTFDDEPTSFVYAIADNYEAVRYFAHDPLGQNRPPADVLASVKRYLAHGIPSMFGFYGFPSANSGDVKGSFPIPCPNERAIWGHAVVAVGYDDKMKIENKRCNKTTTGAFLIRNSWGHAWGDKGYGWLPYEYVLRRLALDFWSLLGMRWVNTGQFGL
jgi:C1A family cysteine protease